MVAHRHFPLQARRAPRFGWARGLLELGSVVGEPYVGARAIAGPLFRIRDGNCRSRFYSSPMKSARNSSGGERVGRGSGDECSGVRGAICRRAANWGWLLCHLRLGYLTARVFRGAVCLFLPCRASAASPVSCNARLDSSARVLLRNRSVDPASLDGQSIYRPGGLHRALARSSLGGRNTSVVGAFDWDQTACAVYTANHGPDVARRVRTKTSSPLRIPRLNFIFYCKVDIGTLDADALEPLNANLWLLSPACQPYTVLNPRAKGAADPRARSFLHLVEEVLPALADRGAAPARLLVENVAGFEVRVSQL
jgi:hypothetical protein